MDPLGAALDWFDENVNPFHGIFGPDPTERAKMAQTGQAPEQGVLAKPVENTLSGIRWLYNEGISRPLSTVQLMGSKIIADPLGNEVIDPNEWSSSWNAAAHISPAQAIGFTNPMRGITIGNPLANLFSTVAEAKPAAQKARQLEAAPLEYQRPQGLPQQFNQLSNDQQQQLLKAANMPVAGNALIEQERRTSALFKYGTGIGDFAISWYADPMVAAGKVASAAKEAAVIRPITASTDISAELNRSIMAKAQDWIYANRSNPQLLNNLPMAKSSALGPRFGAIASTLKTPDEVNLFLRVGMGDTAAMDELASRNAQAGQLLEQDTSRLSALDLMRTRYTNNPTMQGLVNQEMERVQSRISDNVDMQNRYRQIIGGTDPVTGQVVPGAEALIDRINLTRWSFTRAAIDTAKQNAYVAGAARRAGTAAADLPGLPTISPISRVPRAPGAPLAGRLTTAAEQQAMQSPVMDMLPGGGALPTSSIYTNFFATPLTVLRAFGEFRPEGHIQLGDITQDSVRQLRAYAARIPGMSSADRADVVNQFLSSQTEHERLGIVQGLENRGLRAIADRHGFTQDEADAIYAEHQARLGGEKTAMAGKQYSTAAMPTEAGGRVPIDAFPRDDGGFTVAPPLVSQLVNDHQLADLDNYDRVLARHGSALKALRVPAGDAADWLRRAGDFFNQSWKFLDLFRLASIPRVMIGDDLAGQVARLGAATMAARVGVGIKNAATNMLMSSVGPALSARAAVEKVGMDYADGELARLQPQIDELQQMDAARRAMNQRDLATAQRRVSAAQARVDAMDPVNDPFDPAYPKWAAANKLLTRHQGALGAARLRSDIGLSPGQLTTLQQLTDQRDWLLAQKEAKAQSLQDIADAQEKVRQGFTPIGVLPGFEVPGALSGQRGQLYQELISSEDTMNYLFKANKQLVHGNLMRSWDHGATQVNAVRDPDMHMASWLHTINAQFGNDPLARLALANASVQDMTNWLTRTAEGITYRKRLGESLTTAEDLAKRVHYGVGTIAPTPEIRAAALTPDGVTADQLKEQFPDPTTRPDVHRALSASLLAGGNGVRQGVDRVMNAWYKFAYALPADRLSSHPLFNQLYEGQARRIAEMETSQGRNLTADDAERIAEQARLLALRDTRKLIFDIAHKTDAAAALRFMSPFFAATTNAWQRWGRIVADKPQVAGYAAKFFNAPLAAGMVQDKDGNPVDDEGYAYDPVTKQHVLVPKTERYIVGRLPKFLVEGRNPIGIALGANTDGNIKLSQDSMNLVLQGDPWFNPGTGPIAAIPISEWVKDKPSQADLMQQLGVLPFGPPTDTTIGGRIASQVLPRTFRDALSAFDSSDQRYQNIKSQIMQRAAFEHAQFGKPMPSAQEIADRTRNYWIFAAANAFLGPVSGQGDDPYQFYRDEYNKLQRSAQNLPKDQYGRIPVGQDADSQFLEKYGESYFVFAQNMSKNVSGAAATLKAVDLSKRYGDLISQNPELAALIIGPEGNGPFSPGAYAYQLNNPLVPGGAEMQRTRMTADQAMQENAKRLGWAKYNAKLHQLESQLVTRGLQSFNDPGAEDLKAMKTAYTDLWTHPLTPDGKANPYFNKAFADDFNTQNTQKYAELIPGLTALARSALAKDPVRSDLRVLQEYLGARQGLVQQLAGRKAEGGSDTLTSADNQDLLNLWERRVQGLVLSNTSFADLYHRYLSRDMQVDVAQRMADQGVLSGSA